MTSRLWIDLETRSTVDLRNSTPYRYAEDPRFSILMAAWSTDGEQVHLALGEEETWDIPGLWDPGVLKIAHNAPFERICLSRLRGLPVGEYLNPAEFHDTMAVAGEYGYPQSLSALAKALGGEQKDEAGTLLVNFWCKPNRKGKFNRPWDHPEKWEEFKRYCEQDVYTLIDVDRSLGDFPTERERQVYHADQAVNDTGLRVDVEMARLAVAAAEDNRMLQELEISALTGIANPGSGAQMLAWFRSVGVGINNLQKETVAELLTQDLNDDVRRVLELRQELALVASKKFGTALASVSSDGRLRGGFRFFGAHTGRWAGKGTQPHNMPREGFENEADTELAIDELRAGEGASALDLKRLVRPMFLGPMTVVDYAAIEARVIAWLGGEEWALEAFRAGRDIYVETAKRMGGLTRAQGKVAVLALGFAGGVNSLRVMGAQGSDEELQALVYQWRAANPRIARLWAEMENAIPEGGKIGHHLSITRDGGDMAMHLPSGRAIHYHDVRWGTVYGKRGWSYADPKRPGQRVPTYGGRLAENATQAVARDILAEALVRLVDRGYEPVGHVHDEILVDGEHSVEDVSKVMCESPDWAEGLPIDGEGYTTRRYRKG